MGKHYDRIRIPHGLRRALFEENDTRCEYCGRITLMSTGTVDHYLALALGGSQGRSNMRWACWDCNHLKDDKSPEEWEKIKPVYKRELTAYEKKIQILSNLRKNKIVDSKSL